MEVKFDVISYCVNKYHIVKLHCIEMTYILKVMPCLSFFKVSLELLETSNMLVGGCDCAWLLL